MLYALLATASTLVSVVVAAVATVRRLDDEIDALHRKADAARLAVLDDEPERGPWATHRRQTVLVSLIGGDAYRGALWDSGPEGLVLRAAELVLENRTAPVDGELLIPAHRIDVVQVVGAG